MDDETIMRILENMQEKYGEYRMEQGAKFKSYAKILIDKYLYGQDKGFYRENPDGTVSFVHKSDKTQASEKQFGKIYPALKDTYEVRESEQARRDEEKI